MAAGASVRVAFVSIALGLAFSRSALPTDVELVMSVPRVDGLTATFPASASSTGGGDVAVNLQLRYDAKGKFINGGTSTVDGSPVAIKGTLSTKKGAAIYKLALKGTTEKVTVQIGGDVRSGHAVIKYRGPKGKALLLDQPVALVASEGFSGKISLSPQLDSRGKITGSGSIASGLGNDAAGAGVLKGTLKGDKLTLGLANGPQKLAFKGSRSGAGFVGTLKVNLPPEKSVRTSFFVPDPFKPPAPASGPVTFKGQTLLVGNALPLPGLGVTVSAKTDANGNGSIADETPVLSATGPDGKYELQITVVSGRQVFLEFSLTQFGTAMKVLSSVMPGSTIVTDVTLKELGSMAPKSGVAASSDGRLKVSNLPPQVTGVMGRVFDPTTETDQFPGEFQDDGGRFLISSVFAVVEATDNHGNRVEDLGQESLLRMDVSRNSWGTLRDLVAGNGQIDVPFFSFDESSLEWKQSASNGWLEDSQGKLIPEESLSSIRDGSYSGSVFAVGRISHLSYWNVDWPVETHACVQGQVLDQEGKPVSGAKVEVDGVSYSGSSSTVTGSDGTFCVEVFRSEEPGEDLDGDGVPGESQEIRILVVSSDGNFYSFGPFGTAIGQGTCQIGGCRQLPSFTLSPEHQLQVKLCTITGTVVYSGKATGGAPQMLNKGDPVAGIPVFGIDLAAEEALVGCQSSGSCNVFTTSGPDGKFTLTVPVLTGVQLVATGFKTTQSVFDTYTGLLSLSQCPESPVTLEVDFHRVVSLVAALLDENQNHVGDLTVSTEVAICFILINGEAFFGVDESVSSDIPPSQLGPWLQMDLFKSSTQAGDKAGTVLFSAGSLDSPISGTWEAKDTSGSVLLGGTWSEGGR